MKNSIDKKIKKIAKKEVRGGSFSSYHGSWERMKRMEEIWKRNRIAILVRG